MRFGYATSTFDLEGDPLSDDSRPLLDRNRLEEVFLKYVGVVHQTLPPYSAKKVRGKPLYSYARKGIKIETTTKEVVIKSLTSPWGEWKRSGISNSSALLELMHEASPTTSDRTMAAERIWFPFDE